MVDVTRCPRTPFGIDWFTWGPHRGRPAHRCGGRSHVLAVTTVRPRRRGESRTRAENHGIIAFGRTGRFVIRPRTVASRHLTHGASLAATLKTGMASNRCIQPRSQRHGLRLTTLLLGNAAKLRLKPPRTAPRWLRFAAALFRLPRSAGRRHLPRPGENCFIRDGPGLGRCLTRPCLRPSSML